MTADKLPDGRVTVYHDPLCGWCYGATPSVRRLAAQPGLTVELVPAGLFAGAGARPMDARFAEYAWLADQRIGQLTGQPFSECYREQVLADRETKLDSGPATLALTAVALADPARELDALEAIQAARYVAGRDVTAYAVLADVLRSVGLKTAAARVAAPDTALLAATQGRTAEARRALSALGAKGVPTLVIGGRPISSDAIYGRTDDLLRILRAA
jgi:putative protein-disulfide isomerase